MQTLGQLSPVDSIEAKIQARVAKFLGLKIIIVGLTKHNSLSIVSRANALYTNQQIYEKQLQEALDTIERVKTGAYTYSDIIGLGTFAYDMESHINKVEQLQEDAGTSGIPSQLSTSPLTIGILILAGYGIYYAMKK